MKPAEARDRFAAARVARLATAGPDGPHVVPIGFVVVDDVIWSAVDQKPKATRRLKRIRNIEHDPRVSIVVDEWHEDWTRLFWARADGDAEVIASEDDVRARLVDRYPLYADDPPLGPFLKITVRRWSGWSWS